MTQRRDLRSAARSQLTPNRILDPPCYITRLPIEILSQIVHDFRGTEDNPREFSVDLANIARVSHLFYQLAMPLLWRSVQMWPLRVMPRPLLEYPGTPSQRVLNYIRSMHIGALSESECLDGSKCKSLRQFISGCFRVLVAARSVQFLYLNMRLYDPDKYAPELRRELNAINGLTFRILKHVKRMNLRELSFSPRGKNASVTDILRVIERKITVLDINLAPLQDWIDRLLNIQNLTQISVYCDRSGKENEALSIGFWASVSNNFWFAISQMKNVVEVETSDMPLSPCLNYQFSHIIRLYVFVEWTRSVQEVKDAFIAVFTRMPNLEVLLFHSGGGDELEQAISTLEIDDVACKNLKDVNIIPLHPKKLISTIAKQNPNLASCILDGQLTNFGDEDIRCLSECKRLRTLMLRSPTGITNGLSYLTNLPQLSKVTLHYSMAKHMTTQFFQDISLSCPNLPKIKVSDFRTFKRTGDSRPFEEQGLSELFAAGVELHPYIEPRYSVTRYVQLNGLKNYIIRLDKLREDHLNNRSRNPLNDLSLINRF